MYISLEEVKLALAILYIALSILYFMFFIFRK